MSPLPLGVIKPGMGVLELLQGEGANSLSLSLGAAPPVHPLDGGAKDPMRRTRPRVGWGPWVPDQGASRMEAEVRGAHSGQGLRMPRSPP